MTTAIFALPVTIYEIFAIDVCKTVTFAFRMGQDQNINRVIEIPLMTSYIMTIVINV